MLSWVMTTRSRIYWLRLALLCSAATPILHTLVVFANDHNPMVTPVSELSRHAWAVLHTIGLIAFAVAHFALAIALGGLDRGKLWPWARGLLVASGAGLIYLAWYFATAADARLYGSDANDPLWIIASLTGIAMGALQPGLSRLSRGLGLFATVSLGIWLWLIPLVLLVDASWLGGYERLVGSVYVLWLAGVSLGLLMALEDS